MFSFATLQGDRVIIEWSSKDRVAVRAGYTEDIWCRGDKTCPVPPSTECLVRSSIQVGAILGVVKRKTPVWFNWNVEATKHVRFLQAFLLWLLALFWVRGSLITDAHIAWRHRAIFRGKVPRSWIGPVYASRKGRPLALNDQGLNAYGEHKRTGPRCKNHLSLVMVVGYRSLCRPLALNGQINVTVLIYIFFESMF